MVTTRRTITNIWCSYCAKHQTQGFPVLPNVTSQHPFEMSTILSSPYHRDGETEAWGSCVPCLLFPGSDVEELGLRNRWAGCRVLFQATLPLPSSWRGSVLTVITVIAVVQGGLPVSWLCPVRFVRMFH